MVSRHQNGRPAANGLQPNRPLPASAGTGASGGSWPKKARKTPTRLPSALKSCALKSAQKETPSADDPAGPGRGGPESSKPAPYQALPDECLAQPNQMPLPGKRQMRSKVPGKPGLLLTQRGRSPPKQNMPHNGPRVAAAPRAEEEPQRPAAPERRFLEGPDIFYPDGVPNRNQLVSVGRHTFKTTGLQILPLEAGTSKLSPSTPTAKPILQASRSRCTRPPCAPGAKRLLGLAQQLEERAGATPAGQSPPPPERRPAFEPLPQTCQPRP